MKMIYRQSAYEKNGYDRHIFETYRQEIDNAAPYVVKLDDDFLATAESRKDALEEIIDTCEWFGWRDLRDEIQS